MIWLRIKLEGHKINFLLTWQDLIRTIILLEWISEIRAEKLLKLGHWLMVHWAEILNDPFQRGPVTPLLQLS